MNFNHLNQIDGLQFIPLTKNKVPTQNNWQSIKTHYDLSNVEGVGLVCGVLSGGVEAIDFDLKYDLSGTLMNDYIEFVNSVNPNIIPRLVVQQTMSGGFHLVYKCSEIEGNRKLANRASTEQEKQLTYNKSFHLRATELGAVNDVNDPNFQKAAEFAMSSMKNDKNKVLIETRGEKGQIACHPMPGYTMIQGSWDNIQEITPDERHLLIDVACSFNQFFSNKPDRPNNSENRKLYKGLAPSEDYNERGDVVGLLKKHGWTEIKRQGSKVLMRRPGDTNAKTSGNYDEEKRWFSVFSTSTQFETQKPYLPWAVYTILECDGDYSQATKKLAQEGYGDPIEKIKENRNEIPSIIDTSDPSDLSFLATDADTEEYIKNWRNNTFAMGLTTGVPEFDKFFRFKAGNLVIGNGLDNVGKSTVLWYLLLLSSLYHGWKHIIYTSENKAGAFKKKIMEFYLCKSIKDFSDAEYEQAHNFYHNHFRVIKNGETLYNYQDMVNMADKILIDFKANTFLLDPYNSLKVESKQTYEYHYEVASKLKLYGERKNLSIYLNAHVGTGAAKKKDEKGFTIAPGKEDTEMGVMFANKADDFLTFHRLTDHDTEFMFTELHVRKIKETETGGRPTPKYKPIIMRSIEGVVGFIFVSAKNASLAGTNPVKNYWTNKENVEKFNIFPPNPMIDGGDEAPF